NAALRFAPESATPQAAPSRGPLSAIMPRMRMRSRGGQQQQGEARRIGRVYILENGQPAPVMFRAGETDGRMTQVLPVERPQNGPDGAQGEGTRTNGQRGGGQAGM